MNGLEVICVGLAGFLAWTCQKARMSQASLLNVDLHMRSWHSHATTTVFTVTCASRPRAYNLHANRLCGPVLLVLPFLCVTLRGGARGLASQRGLRSFRVVEFAVESNLSFEWIAHRYNA